MSLYNALFGVNKLSPLLLAILNIDQGNENSYSSGRFRDIYLNEDGSSITLYTRNGGGNRDDYQHIFDKFACHPNYIRDWDDDFDCTYAYIEFSVPDKFKEWCKELANGEEIQSIGNKFKDLIETL